MNLSSIMNVKTEVEKELFLKKEHSIRFIAYRGQSKIDADNMFNFAKSFHDNKKPMPLRQTMFGLEITDIKIDNSEDVYEVWVKGRLI